MLPGASSGFSSSATVSWSSARAIDVLCAALFFDGTGMSLFSKRLDRATFQVPEAGAETGTVTIVERVLDDRLDGIAVEGTGRRSRMPVRR